MAANDKLVAAYRRFSRLAGAMCAAVGLLVLAGWMLHSSLLTSLHPRLVAMNPLTALCFVVAGGSLWLQARPEATWVGGVSSHRFAKGCAVAVAGFGLLRFSELVFGWHLGVDQVLFASQLESAPAGWPNRMAPNTALAFMFTGTSLLLLGVETRRKNHPADFLALGGGLLALLALVGYAYGVARFYGLSSFIPMALNTAVAFFLLSLGLLCARPGRGLMALVASEGVGGVVARRLLPAAVGVPLVLGWARWHGEKAGLYETAFGIALYTTAMIVILAVLVWQSARFLERVDEERRCAERELDRFFSLSLDLLCIAGFDGYFKRLNPAWEKTLGFTCEELLRRPYLDFIHPDDRQSTQAEAQQIAGGANTVSFENRYRCKDGSYRWLLWKATPVVEEKLIHAAARDVTEQKHAQQALKESEERHRRLFENSPQPMWVFDLETLAFLAVNDSAVLHYGYSREEFLAMTVRDIRPPEDVPEFLRHLGSYSAQPTTATTWRHRKKDGSVITVEVHAQRLRFGGRPASLVLVYDVTERNEVQARLQRLNTELEATNKELETFTYSVSHDLRAPLRHVAGFTRILLDDYAPQLPADAQHCVARIQQGVEQMGMLVDGAAERRPADRRGAGGDAPAHGNRRADLPAAALVRVGASHHPLAPRALGRERLPRWPARRGHPAAGAHPATG